MGRAATVVEMNELGQKALTYRIPEPPHRARRLLLPRDCNVAHVSLFFLELSCSCQTIAVKTNLVHGRSESLDHRAGIENDALHGCAPRGVDEHLVGGWHRVRKREQTEHGQHGWLVSGVRVLLLLELRSSNRGPKFLEGSVIPLLTFIMCGISIAGPARQCLAKRGPRGYEPLHLESIPPRLVTLLLRRGRGLLQIVPRET